MAKETRLKRALNAWKGIEERSISVAPTNAFGIPYGTNITPAGVEEATQLSAVYRCVEVISDAIASEEWEVLGYTDTEGWTDDPFSKVSYMLNTEPSPLYSRYTMMKALVSRVLLWGNGYLIIHRDGVGNPKWLELVDADVTRFINEDGSSYYKVGQSAAIGKEYTIIQDFDMIHILNKSYDGLMGVSTLDAASKTIETATSSEDTAKGFFAAGANMAGILSVDDELSEEQADKMKAAWAAAFNSETGSPGGIAVIEGAVKFAQVNVNPKDAQMLESRRYNVIEICRFFGVAPAKVFDSENLTYSNIESFQLGFITDTVAPLNAKIEAEFNRKLLRPSQRRFTKLNLNIEALLSNNLDSKANYLRKMFEIGGVTVNEVREALGNSKVKNGDDSYVPANLKSLNEPEVVEVIPAPIVEPVKDIENG